MEEKLSQNYKIKPFLESCKPLIVNSNILYTKSDVLNVKFCKTPRKNSESKFICILKLKKRIEVGNFNNLLQNHSDCNRFLVISLPSV